MIVMDSRVQRQFLYCQRDHAWIVPFHAVPKSGSIGFTMVKTLTTTRRSRGDET